MSDTHNNLSCVKQSSLFFVVLGSVYLSKLSRTLLLPDFAGRRLNGILGGGECVCGMYGV